MVSLSRRNSERCSEIEKMKNKREDRFEAIVDQFVKNDLIAQEEYSYYLYGVKHLEVLIMTTGGVLLSGILLKEILFTVVFLITFSLLRIGWQGIHAKTKIRCFCYSLLLFLSGIYVKKQVVRSIDLFSQAVFMGSMLIILLLTALWKYKIDGKLNELKRCFWILGGVRWMKWQSDWKKEEKYVSGKSWTGSEKRSRWWKRWSRRRPGSGLG